MEIREIVSEQESLAVFHLLHDIRTHLTEESYLSLLYEAKSQGYILLGLYQNEECIGLMGYRVIVDFVHGKHVYIDDLVISPDKRSLGLGTILLEHAEKIAKENGCAKVRLCTGVGNERGKTFYEKNKWALRAVVYKKTIELT